MPIKKGFKKILLGSCLIVLSIPVFLFSWPQVIKLLQSPKKLSFQLPTSIKPKAMKTAPSALKGTSQPSLSYTVKKETKTSLSETKKSVDTKGSSEKKESPKRGAIAVSQEKTENVAVETFGEKERERKEGILWFDRKNQQYVVTLGTLNGVFSDAALTVYDKDQKIAEVTVVTSFDVLSYVKVSEKTVDLSVQASYRVVKE